MRVSVDKSASTVLGCRMSLAGCDYVQIVKCWGTLHLHCLVLLAVQVGVQHQHGYHASDRSLRARDERCHHASDDRADTQFRA